MTWFSRNAARAAAVSLFLGAAFVVPASAQRVQDITPLPASAPASAPAAVEPVSTPASEPSGPRVRADIARVEPALAGSPSAVVRRDASHTITLSTIALILLVVVIVLLVA